MFEAEEEVRGDLGIGRGAEDLVLVVPERLQSGSDVGRMILRIVGDAALGGQK